METSFIRPLAIASGASVSASYQIGHQSANGSPMVPLAVILPASLAGATRLKFQVSKDDSTWYDILFGTGVLYLTETVSSVVLVPARIQQGCWGFSFIRLVTMDGSNVAFAVTAATSIDVVFGNVEKSNPNVDDPNATTLIGAGSSIIGRVGIDQTTPGTTDQVTTRTSITTIKTTVTRPADGNAYAVGDCFSNSTSAPTSGGGTFTSAARASGGSGRITDAVISMSAKSAFQGEIWVFDQAATNTNDNAAIALSAADALNCVGVIPFNVNDTGSVAGISYVTGLDIRYTCVGTANLRFLVVVKAAFTPASGEVLGICLKVEN